VKKLFVGNLSFKMLEEDLQKVFSNFGAVKEAKIILDRETERSRGFAFVTMENDADADKAMADLNGKEIGGRTIVVNEARERTSGGKGVRGNNGHGGYRGSDRDYN
jgi:RNA recognition motif-containing protein